jgi:hypothetical protein
MKRKRVSRLVRQEYIGARAVKVFFLRQLEIDT